MPSIKFVCTSNEGFKGIGPKGFTFLKGDDGETIFVNTSTLKVGNHVVGRLARYNEDRGFGFLEVVDMPEHEDIFLHVSGVPTELRDRLTPGTLFEIVIGESDRGLLANVQKVVDTQLAAE